MQRELLLILEYNNWLLNAHSQTPTQFNHSLGCLQGALDSRTRQVSVWLGSGIRRVTD